MNSTKSIIRLCILASISIMASMAQATKCGQVVYNKHGMLRKYEVLPLDISEGLKKHGVSSTSPGTTETTTASVDPGVTTGTSDSQTQSTSTKGDCKWGGFFGAAERQDLEHYVEQNLNQIKNQMAVGQGGHIEMLASYSNCNQAKIFGQALQKNMNKFIDFNEKDSKAFVDQIQELISTDDNLSLQCQSVPLAKN
jgi:hypothetical protein